MGTLLEIWNFSSLNQEEIEKLHKLVTSSDIAFLIKNLPANRSPGPGNFTGGILPNIVKELIPILI